MRTVAALALVAVGGLVACGGGDGDGSPTGPDPTGEIIVSVTEGDSGVEGADLTLETDEGSSQATATTGADGTASFDDVEPGSYEVEVVPPDPYVLAGDESFRGSASLSVSVDAGASTRVTFELIFTVSDIDGNVYPTTVIGDQRWTAENLNVAHYRNGDPVPEEQSADAWKAARQADRGAWVYFENDPAHATNYGRLYNQYAVADPRGLCPEGWHVPTEADWRELELHLGMDEDSLSATGTYRGEEEEVGGKLKSQRTEPLSHPRWNEPNNAATNETEFSAIPNGFRVGKPLRGRQTEGEFRELGNEGPLWTSTNAGNPEFPERFWGRTMQHEEIGVWRGGADGFGLAVRCVMSR